MKNTNTLFNRIIQFFLKLNVIGAALAFFIMAPLTAFAVPVSMNLSSQLIDENGQVIEESTSTSTTISPTSIVLVVSIFFLTFCYFFASFHLDKFFGNISKGNYFDKSNGKRLQFIGYSFVVGSLYLILYNNSIVSTLSTNEVKLIPLNNFVLPGISSNLTGVIMGLMFIVVAQAFIQGNKLKEESELTV